MSEIPSPTSGVNNEAIKTPGFIEAIKYAGNDVGTALVLNDIN